MVVPKPAGPGNRSVPTPAPGTFDPGAPPAVAPGTIVTPPAAPAAPVQGPVQGPEPMQPGSDVYDWYSVNEALRNAGLEGWQIAGTSHSPINQGRWVKNPAYNSLFTPQENKDAGRGDEYTWEVGKDYVIGVVNPSTGQMLKVTLGRQGDASTGYTWAVTDRQDTGKLDKTNPGHSGVQRIPFSDGHEEMWGTNTQTGAFEKLPNQPADLGNFKGWNDVKQIDDGQGHLVWVGTNPQGQPLQVIPNQPQINTAKYVPGSVRQVTKNGKQVYVGQNAQTQGWEDIPELGSEVVPPQTTTVGGRVYKPNPNAGQPNQPDFVPVSGIASANEGDRQWADAGGGYVKRQVYHNGLWSDVGPDDEEGIWRPVNPATVRAEGALKPAGTKYYIPLPGSPGTLVQVTADGNGGFDYVPDPATGQLKITKVAGVEKPTDIAAGGGEFLPPRRDPVSGQVIPGERNPAWTPTNVGDRVRQLQQLARQKQAELHQQVTSGQIDEAAADQQFSQWWDTEIAPRQQALAADQAKEQQQQQILANQEQRAQETQRMNLLTSAQGQGQQAVQNYLAQAKNMVGPGFQQWGAALGQSISSGGKPPPVNPADFQYLAPDLNELSQYYTAQALKYVSPTAAQMTGTQPVVPQAQGMDLNSLLGRTQFQPSAAPPTPVQINIGTGAGIGTGGGAAPAAAPAAAPVVQPSAVAAATPDQWGIQKALGTFRMPVEGLT